MEKMPRADALIGFAETIGLKVLQKEPMAAHTTFKIGGAADFFVEIKEEKKLIQIFKFLQQNKMEYRIIGNGSNLLAADGPIHKVIVRLAAGDEGIELIDQTTLCAFAGVSLARICGFAALHSLTGLEFACGIPARLGGAVYMNASAYGGAMSDVLAEITYIDELGNLQKITANKARFGYRNSIFMQRKLTVVAAKFSLKKGNSLQILEQMRELIGKRRAKQPLEYPSAGSVFKRPSNGFAGQMIEECGLKGARVGAAAVSEKHAGFIVNLGGATCQDVLALIKKIQDTVFEKKKTKLELEVEYLD